MKPVHDVGHWTLPGESASVRAARALVREAMAEHPLLEDVELVVTELVANAVEHGRGPIEVGLQSTAGILRLTVTSDTGSAEPEVLPPSHDAGGGRGLALVAAIAQRWDWERHGERTAVWAEFADA
jgi:anti-sigma regulatory factor (Ser/Thr protein kinase)